MNTTQEQLSSNNPLLELPATVLADENRKLELALAAAQEEIAEIKDQRREERVGWIVVCVVLFDCFFLISANNFGGPLVIGLLQVGALAVLAKRMGVQEFYALFASVMQRLGRSILDGDK